MHEKVVIIGGGFGGLTIAQCLAKSDKKVTLIDRTNHHLFQPLLYQVATAALSSSDIAVPIRQVLQGQKNTEVVMGEVRLIDRGKREVVLADGRNYVFDRLVVAIGSEPGYFGKDDWRKHSLALKTLNDAFAIKERILLSYEIAESSSDQVEREKNLTFVIVGGGPTGVELAGAIADIANHTLLGNFRHIDPSSTRIYLIEGGDRILAQFSEELSRISAEYLKGLGVNIITGQRVTHMEEGGIKAEELFIKSNNILWTAGVQAPALLQKLDTPLDKAGRVEVGPDLTIPGEEWVFVIGDAAMAKDHSGNPLPGLAQVAIQQGRFVCDLIANGTPQEERPPFAYRDMGILTTVGKKFAVARMWKGIEFSGFFAWLLWSFVHIWKLVFFRSKVMVFINWAYYYLTGQRGSQVIIPDKTKCDN